MAVWTVEDERRYTVAKRRLEDMRGGGAGENWRTKYLPYAGNPVGFAKDVLHIWPWSKQRRILEDMRDYPRTSVRACHGSGKSYIVAAGVEWFLFTHPNSKVITTAPTGNQVRNVLWREIRAHHRRGNLPGHVTIVGVNLDDQWFALGMSTDEPANFSGFHADHILVVVDEASGVDEPIFEAAEGLLTTSNSRYVLIGNPLSNAGTFYDSHHSNRANWHTEHISAFDTPNFTGERIPPQAVANLVTPAYAESRKAEWGEDNPLYMARVMGEFPSQVDKALFDLAWLEAAGRRDALSYLPNDYVEAGLDVARQGSCENALCIRRGANVLHLEAWREPDLMKTVGRVNAALAQWDVRRVKVDGTGMGYGVVDRLKEVAPKGCHVACVLVGDKPQDPERFCLLRDELWWNMRERAREGTLAGLSDQKAVAQMAAVQFSYDSRGRIRVESKEEMSKRGLASPDRADGVCLAFYRASVPAAAAVVHPVDDWMHSRRVNPYG